MSVASILKEKKQWPDIYNFLKESSPYLDDFSVLGESNRQSENVRILEEIELSSSESTQIGNYSEFLFALVLCRRLVQNKERSFKTLCWSFEVVHSRNYYSEYIREKAEKLKALLYSYVSGAEIDFPSLVNASRFSDVIEKEGLLYAGVTEFETNQRIEAVLREELSEHIIDVLRVLVAVFEKTFIENNLIHSDSIVIYHPWFEPWGQYLGGATADLYIDGYIYELKSGKREKNKWIDIGQIYAYYLLSQLCEQDEEDAKENNFMSLFNLSKNEVEGIAIYYSRTGIVKKCPIKVFNTLRRRNDESVFRGIIAKKVNAERMEQYERRMSFFAERLLRTRYSQIQSGKREIKHFYTEKEYPYSQGERVFLPKEGWGTIQRIVQVDGELCALISMENGKHIKFSINKVETISMNDPELLNLVGKLELLPEQ